MHLDNLNMNVQISITQIHKALEQNINPKKQKFINSAIDNFKIQVAVKY